MKFTSINRIDNITHTGKPSREQPSKITYTTKKKGGYKMPMILSTLGTHNNTGFLHYIQININVRLATINMNEDSFDHTRHKID